VAELVVALTFIGVAEYLVGFVELFELLFRTGLLIGM
jgi:hypothetical protein